MRCSQGSVAGPGSSRVRGGGANRAKGPNRRMLLMRSMKVLAICAMTAFAGVAQAQEIDWKKVDEALGKTAAVSGEVHRYGLPRSDLKVTLDGVTIRPALALGGWVAFQPMHGQAMIMGDLVLLE